MVVEGELDVPLAHHRQVHAGEAGDAPQHVPVPDDLVAQVRAARERLVEWVRSFGVTTIHTGHGPGALVSGETPLYSAG